jgi:hypothetical protein
MYEYMKMPDRGILISQMENTILQMQDFQYVSNSSFHIIAQGTILLNGAVQV